MSVEPGGARHRHPQYGAEEVLCTRVWFQGASTSPSAPGEFRRRPKGINQSASERCPVPSASRGCTEDEGRPFGVALQGEAPNRHERLGSKAPVVSVMEKAGAPVRWWRER